MAEVRDPASRASETSSYRVNNTNDSGDFECNICFDLAQDPVITLCGHLYCWPCLYRWLQVHSHSHECPVCKALVEEEKVIPLYGRGKTPVDPRSKPIPGVEIPNRPQGQRPEMPTPSEDINLSNFLFGLMGGFMPIASATFSNVGVSAGFGGVFPPFFGFQFNGFPGAGGYGGSSGYRPGHGPNRGTSQAAQTDDENLKKILFIVLFFVLFAFLTM